MDSGVQNATSVASVARGIELSRQDSSSFFEPVTISIGAIPMAVAQVGPDGRVFAANGQFVDFVGTDPTGHPLADLFAERDRTLVVDLMTQSDDVGPLIVSYGSRPSTSAILRLSAISGGQHLAFLEPNPDDNPLGEIATRALDVLGQGIVVGDGTRILSATSGAAELFGRPVEDLLDIGSLFSLFEESEQQRLTQLAADCAQTGDPMPDRFRTALVRPDGEVLPVDLWIRATVRAGRTRTYTVIADARESAIRDAELAQRATHDHLTGLPNRYLLLDRLESALRRLDRSEGDEVDGEAVLYFIDLDDFKLVNDTFGHAAGDRVLIVVAERILNTVRATDTAARIGGDEFVVLSESMAGNDHEELRDRLDAVLRRPVIVDGMPIETRASIGLCLFSDGTMNADDVLASADQDMYGLKSAHRAHRNAQRGQVR